MTSRAVLSTLGLSPASAEIIMEEIEALWAENTALRAENVRLKASADEALGRMRTLEWLCSDSGREVEAEPIGEGPR